MFYPSLKLRALTLPASAELGGPCNELIRDNCFVSQSSIDRDCTCSKCKHIVSVYEILFSILFEKLRV